jgi:adenylate cyclase
VSFARGGSYARVVGTEIERKFLVAEDWSPPHGVEPAQVRQGYLTDRDCRTEVRVRAYGDRRLVTVKRDRSCVGALVRDEVEFPVPADAFESLWELTSGERIVKLRYSIPVGRHEVTVDVYVERPDGLRVAEVEFDSEEAAAAFEPPAWFGEDVTGDPRYANRQLAT